MVKLTVSQQRSWATLPDTAEVRQDDKYPFMRKEGVTREDNPRGYYHRLCYQNYTNKINLRHLQNNRRKEQDESAPATTTLAAESQVCTNPSSSTAVIVDQGSSSSARTTRRSLAKTNFSLCLLC